MILNTSKKLPALFSLLIAGLCMLLLNACGETSKQDAAEETTARDNNSSELITLPDSIPADQATIYIDYFKNCPESELGRNFFFDEVIEQSEKLLTLILDSTQEASFYHRLKAYKEESSSTIELYIYMALASDCASETTENTVNFSPLLVIMKDTVADSVYYPLKPSQTDVLAQFDGSVGDCPVDLGCGDEQFSPINASCYGALFDNWENIAVDDVSKQLYEDQETGIAACRVQYFAFDNLDTDSIYTYMTDQMEGENHSFFYLHLGQYDEANCIPLRTILHLDDAGTNPTNAYFEFARPCPPYCESGTVNCEEE